MEYSKGRFSAELHMEYSILIRTGRIFGGFYTNVQRLIDITRGLLLKIFSNSLKSIFLISTKMTKSKKIIERTYIRK